MKKLKQLTISALILAMVIILMPINFNIANANYSNKIEDVRVAEYNTSVRIIWKTERSSITKIFYGENSKQHETLITSDYKKREHIVYIKALDPDTTYYYRIV